jgi:DNA-binding transcriptional regulator YhcF (GntR family)
MPSIRDAEAAWGVNRLAIHGAYKKLASQGIALSKPRSGYYVTNQDGVQRISNHRVELENLFQTFSDTITKSTGLAALPVFRYLARLAQIRDREVPMCAFAECTLLQAEAHAREVTERLHVSVVPLTVADIAGKRSRIPGNVSVLLTTHFHYAELAPLRHPEKLEIVAVPVDVSIEIADLVHHDTKAVILLEHEQETAGTMATDAGRILNRPPLEIRVSNDIHGAFADMFGSRKSSKESDTVAFVSPHEWRTIDRQWKEHPNVHLLPLQIREEAWDLIADVVGVPMGGLG